MTEYSYPVEEQPMPVDNWQSVTRGLGDGVFDEGGSPYQLTNLSNSTNTVELTAANMGGGVRRSHAILGGFYHKIDANLTLEIPAVTTATTFYIALQLDTVRGSEGGLPVVAGVFTSLDRTSGKEYLVLHEIDRAPNQLLTDAARRWVRPRISPVISVSRGRELPPSASVMRWTLALIHGGGTGVPDLRINSESGWRSLLSPDWEDLPDVSSAVRASGGQQLAIQRVGTTRKLRGRVQRQSGANYLAGQTGGYIIAYLSDRDVPELSSRHVAQGLFGSGETTVQILVQASDKQVRVIVPHAVGQVDLGTIEWQVPEVN